MAVTSPRSGANQYPVPPLDWRDPREHRRLLAEAVRNLMDGHHNATGTVTLTASQSTTTVSDRRVGPGSVVTFMPVTANAASEIGAGGMYVSSRTSQSFTITHANNAQNDRTFAYAVSG